MTHVLPPLPYPKDALAPVISAETLEFHHGKHHKAYVDKLNELIVGTEWAEASLEDIIKKAPMPGPIFNNGAQVWNHTFYWNCLSPNGGGEPKGALLEAINKSFGDFTTFKTKFSTQTVGHFASAWGWLVKNADGSLAITSTSNAENPMRGGAKPLMTCDVWEHAYYIDYRNLRAKYVEAFWTKVNWDFVSKNFSGS
jgi:Fe-Mn family superoxide dismutase